VRSDLGRGGSQIGQIEAVAAGSRTAAGTSASRRGSVSTRAEMVFTAAIPRRRRLPPGASSTEWSQCAVSAKRDALSSELSRAVHTSCPCRDGSGCSTPGARRGVAAADQVTRAEGPAGDAQPRPARRHPQPPSATARGTPVHQPLTKNRSSQAPRI